MKKEKLLNDITLFSNKSLLDRTKVTKSFSSYLIIIQSKFIFNWILFCTILVFLFSESTTEAVALFLRRPPPASSYEVSTIY